MTFIIQWGGALFAGAVLVLSLVAWFEYMQAFSHKGSNLTFFTGIVALVLLWGCGWLGNTDEFLAVVSGIVLVILLAPPSRVCCISVFLSPMWCSCVFGSRTSCLTAPSAPSLLAVR